MKKKEWMKSVVTMGSAALLTLSIGTGAFAKELPTQPTSYKTVTEIEDWGAAITKVIVDLGRPVPVGSVTKDTFNVHVARYDNRLTNPSLGEGNRVVTKAYVSDKDGNPTQQMGQYAVLELKIGPTDSLGAGLNYANGRNAWVDSKYTITQQKDIVTSAGKVSGLTVNTFAGGTRVLVDDFHTGKATYGDTTLSYADFTPKVDNHKNPLIIWLHGGGEGGTDPTIPISANKADSFASQETQSYFDGAYVLAPQAPTFWMNGTSGSADGTSIYEDALISMIKDYVANHKDVDPNRIYVGGDSNGGYMTMLLTRDLPGYFAAAFPTCEGLNNSKISDADLQNLIQTPTWFIAAKNDTTLPPAINTLPTYNRYVQAGATNVHLSLFDDVHDTTGLYKNDDGTAYQYPGHWSWIYVYNNEPTNEINGKTTTLMEWLAAQSK
ncbi:prolyl oligopeptidase family serine peptidase [Neobacillus cucumis]|uniref:prolyl oligopeptidase family serine peptidase n=1 Tax=Neobacillus cucumis TaxID=1740721 RepID=UPI001962AB6E|nr:prolyl oligopeptidase family serine peptidase [Neobacillus cucumis]MBM7651196.1 putative peptidase [Neobacillus cucumis]